MKLSLLSSKYRVEPLKESDIPQIYELCKENELYYHYAPPFVTEQNIKEDMEALPEGKTLEDKFYIGFWDGDQLVAIMDLISGYPDKVTAFIGFFMVDVKYQKRNIGSKIITEVCDYLKEEFSFVRLAYVNGNKQSESFWLKNGFEKTGRVVQKEHYEVVLMQRQLL